MIRTTKSAEIRAKKGDNDEPIIEGYAAVFGKPYENGWGGTEYISPGAFSDCLLGDTVCVFDHDNKVILGRSKAGKGTLEMKQDNKGLWFRCVLPESRRDIYELIERGDITGCSFKFYAGETRYIENEDNTYERHIDVVSELLDVGPVVNPAYEDTEIEARSIKEAITPKTKFSNWQADHLRLRARIVAI